MQKDITIIVALSFICAIVWIALPMSVFSENNPVITMILKVAGTICGIVAIIKGILYGR